MTLELLDWHDGDLLAAPVFDALKGLVEHGTPESKILGVTINSDEESDTDLWCPKYGIPFEQTGNVVVVHTHKTRKAPPQFAAAFVTADTRADLNGVVKRTLEVSKVSFAPIADAVDATGMESGGMSPIGLPESWPLLVDQHILSIPKLYLGSGIRPSKLVVDGSIFDDIPGVTFVAGLGHPRG
ncbi:hypothetical protein KIH79_09560 [Bifidobacterium sp. 82T10]|uniref:YbaK/aminoacyl-tRNA synthetase-associated domain-containing protein n=1 Tax=Bifidobacterium miconis TaxID=2834435 RepID=A0ABS6WGH6_9BIFI|nr:YbaK/EbsC family protein [Bifidobacterium miconis]MBW3093159.1 hypothetical protein [Bifidobacterium miconis]